MTGTRRRVAFDWAGPHGTVTGTVNACLTALFLGCAGWVIADKWPVPSRVMVVIAAAGSGLGVASVLLRAALRSRRTPPVTILYQVSCWAGAGWWLGRLWLRPIWDWRWFVTHVGLLAVLAVLAGLVAWLASEPLARQAEKAPDQPETRDRAQADRNALAVEWEARIRRICGIEAMVPNVEQWAAGNGYSVEVICPEGGSSWRDIAAKVDEIAADLDLEVGCRASVQMGRSRRAAIVDVMTVSTLAEEKPYPADYGPLSIHDPLPVGVRDDDTTLGPDLRSKCMLLVGETGSGKTNAGHDVGVGVMRTTDALLWDIDMTGGGLFLPTLRPFLDGRAAQPAIDWAAWDEQEAMLMTRAARRAGHARKSGYQELMRQANDDKIPVSAHLPAVILRMDEIKPVTGAPYRFPDLNANLSDVIFELRASAFRVVLLGLRATADIVGPDIQAQCHVVAVMRAKSDAEYAWAFGWHSGAAVADAQYPGCGFISLESGAKPVPMKWWRLRPNQLEEIAMAVDGRQPEMDELTRLALDGRSPDGSPVPGLLAGELDCYTNRWDRFRARFGGGRPEQAPAATIPAPAAAELGAEPAASASPQQAMADLATTMADLERAVAEAEARAAGPVPRDPPPVDDAVKVDDEAWAMVLASWEADPFVPDREPQQPTDVPPSDGSATMLTIVAEYGLTGVGPKELLAALAEHGVVIHRDTLHTWLRDAIERGEVERPRQGKYVRRMPQ